MCGIPFNDIDRRDERQFSRPLVILSRVDRINSTINNNRPTLIYSSSKNHKIIVAEDRQKHQAVGAYACNIKDVFECGEKKTLYSTSSLHLHHRIMQLETIEISPQYDQCQITWKVSSPVKVNPLPSNCSQIRFMKMIENQDNAFQQ
ncbi:hypothetical protein DFA_11772 [Cavenderia fasciculata]|uniref:Uncharacterized protein n=1 Tax=Cavenderia fasciculata TaxID=261658 RepID=F4QE63_CACFS|nr:uncharacterized protein DFA_11772 [Cavenderia fasciculata]EGG14010.1 hypothetical protein DFA_11772 [Cavenderia fasciculata]|eukprot:XP_004350718.1 hypothetical protein DFA_11772 [Cavenderia fasciculata]